MVCCAFSAATNVGVRRTVPAHSRQVAANAKTAGERVKNTLKPRVDELRNEQVSKAKTSVPKIQDPRGPLPELANGRLAMLAFVATVGSELWSHITIFEQIKIAPYSILATVFIIIAASAVPIVKGSKTMSDGTPEGKPGGFNFTNELINGRAAMVGLALLITYEAIAGKPLFG